MDESDWARVRGLGRSSLPSRLPRTADFPVFLPHPVELHCYKSHPSLVDQKIMDARSQVDRSGERLCEVEEEVYGGDRIPG